MARINATALPENWGTLPFQEAIDAMAARDVVLPAVYYGELQGIARQLAFSIAMDASLSQLTAVSDSLKQYTANGGNFNHWQKEQAVIDLGLPKRRLDNIWRTNLQGQYMAGHWEQFNSVKTPLYLMYDAINDSRTRPSHAALDGIIREKGDAFWSSHSPPMGYRCRCSLIALTKSEAQKRSGNNKGLNQHPILENGQPAKPDKGWDYDKTNRMAGIEKAIAEKPKGLLKNTMLERLKALESIPLASQEKILSDYRQTHGSIVDSVERDLLGVETAKKYGLTHPETVMLNAYARQGYMDLNKLHNGLETFDEKTTQTLENASKILSQALSKLPDFDDTVRRVTNYSPEFLAKHKAGDTVVYDGFTSTTFSEEFVWEDSVRLIIESKTGKDIAQFSPHEEYEVLLDKGAKFKVMKVVESGKGHGKITEITLEEI